MALAKVQSCAVAGLDGELVDVEVDIARGMPHFSIVGLPDAALQEGTRPKGPRVRVSPPTSNAPTAGRPSLGHGTQSSPVRVRVEVAA